MRSGNSGTQMEREWNANGTHLGTRSGRVPNAFSVRLFLSSTVNYITQASLLLSDLILNLILIGAFTTLYIHIKLRNKN